MSDYYLYAMTDGSDIIESMEKIADSCEKLGIAWPKKVKDFFDESGEPKCKVLIWCEGDCQHESVSLASDNPYYPIQIDIGKLPKGTKYLVLECSV